MSNDRSQRQPTAPGFWRQVFTGVGVALVGSVLVGTLECFAASLLCLPKYSDGGWPLGLTLAAIGKVTVTHAMVWIPLFGILGAACRLPLLSRWAHQPLAFHTALFVGVVGLIVVPADLSIAGKSRLLILVPACIGVVIASAVAYWMLRTAERRLEGLVQKAFLGMTGLSVCILLVSGLQFWRSPLANPAQFQVAQSTETHAPGEVPNVVVIVMDTVRSDHMSLHGYSKPTTPFLDSLAKEAIIFDGAIADGTWTVPSHASLFTGRSAREHGLLKVGVGKLDKSIPTLAGILRKHGYSTASFSNNPWISPMTELDRGFDESRVVYHLKYQSRFSLEYILQEMGVTPPLPWLDKDFGASLTNYLISRWLDRHRAETKPFFVFVNYLEAHLPYEVPKTYRELFMDPSQVSRSYDLRSSIYGSIVEVLNKQFNLEDGSFLPQSDRDVLKLQYDATIRYLDERVGDLIGMLEQRALLDNTLVIITSDHGEYLGTHQMWGHRFMVYNDLVRVPLMIRNPREPESVRVSTPVQLSDIYRTVLKFALDKDEPESQQGTEDLFQLAASKPRTRVVVSEYGPPSDKDIAEIQASENPHVQHYAQGYVAAQDNQFKLIQSDAQARELFDLEKDPEEANNLAATDEKTVQQLATYLDLWQANHPRYASEDKPTAPAEIDPETMDALRGLGYID